MGQEALKLREELGDRVGQAMARHTLGYVHRHLGDHGQAVACYRSALEVFREANFRYLEADTLIGLGDAHEAAGDADTAGNAWRQGLTILEELRHPRATQVRERLGRRA